MELLGWENVSSDEIRYVYFRNKGARCVARENFLVVYPVFGMVDDFSPILDALKERALGRLQFRLNEATTI